MIIGWSRFASSVYRLNFNDWVMSTVKSRSNLSMWHTNRNAGCLTKHIPNVNLSKLECKFVETV